MDLPGRRPLGKKWRSWSVILTNSQLIFLKDTVWALTLNDQIERLAHTRDRIPGSLLLPTFTDFKPDEVIGLSSCAAIFDRSYTKVGLLAVYKQSRLNIYLEQHENTFRLGMSQGREYLLQANDESDMNAWISLVNWAAASKALGIPTAPVLPSAEEDGKAHHTGINDATKAVGRFPPNNVKSGPGLHTPSEPMASIGLSTSETALASPLSRSVSFDTLQQSPRTNWNISSRLSRKSGFGQTTWPTKSRKSSA